MEDQSISLPVPLITQDPESDDCVVCCMQMLFSYYSKQDTCNDIRKYVHVYKKHSGFQGSFLQDAGMYAITKGLTASIYHYDWQWWDRKTIEACSKNVERKTLVQSLTRLQNSKGKPTDRKIIDKDIAFIKAGGQFQVQLPCMQTITSYLSINIPPIVIVQAEPFYKDNTQNFTHAVVVSGVEDNRSVILKDPYRSVEKIPADMFLYSWSLAGGWMLVIR